MFGCVCVLVLGSPQADRIETFVIMHPGVDEFYLDDLLCSFARAIWSTQPVNHLTHRQVKTEQQNIHIAQLTTYSIIATRVREIFRVTEIEIWHRNSCKIIERIQNLTPKKRLYVDYNDLVPMHSHSDVYLQKFEFASGSAALLPHTFNVCCCYCFSIAFILSFYCVIICVSVSCFPARMNGQSGQTQVLFCLCINKSYLFLLAICTVDAMHVDMPMF